MLEGIYLIHFLISTYLAPKRHYLNIKNNFKKLRIFINIFTRARNHQIYTIYVKNDRAIAFSIQTKSDLSRETLFKPYIFLSFAE